jgi:hypothetical protein
VVTLRCTRKLLERLPKEDLTSSDASPTTALGDWSATIVFSRSAHIVVCVSEVTLLPVLLPAAPMAGLAERLPLAVAEMLLAIGVMPSAVASETVQMTPISIGQTNNRRVLGTMNDFLRMLPDDLDRSETLLEAALRLAEAPCGVIGMDSPRRATLRRFTPLN